MRAMQPSERNLWPDSRHTQTMACIHRKSAMRNRSQRSSRHFMQKQVKQATTTAVGACQTKRRPIA